MILDINLLPSEPEAGPKKEDKKKVMLVSVWLVAAFLIINLLIFGFYFFLVKNTADTLSAIDKQEQKIAALAPQEKIYRLITAKLAFLVPVWQNKIKSEDSLNFSETLLLSEVTLNKLSFAKSGQTKLNLSLANSEILDSFVGFVKEQEKDGKIKNIELVSTTRNDKGGYDLILKFTFLGGK